MHENNRAALALNYHKTLKTHTIFIPSALGEAQGWIYPATRNFNSSLTKEILHVIVLFDVLD